MKRPKRNKKGKRTEVEQLEFPGPDKWMRFVHLALTFAWLGTATGNCCVSFFHHQNCWSFDFWFISTYDALSRLAFKIVSHEWNHVLVRAYVLATKAQRTRTARNVYRPKSTVSIKYISLSAHLYISNINSELWIVVRICVVLLLSTFNSIMDSPSSSDL